MRISPAAAGIESALPGAASTSRRGRTWFSRRDARGAPRRPHAEADDVVTGGERGEGGRRKPVIPARDHTVAGRSESWDGDLRRRTTVGPRKNPRTSAIAAARMPPSRHTATAFAVLSIVERLADRDDHREPASRSTRVRKRAWCTPGTAPEDRRETGVGGKSHRAQQLARARSRLRFGHQPAADFKHHQRPGRPREQRDDTKERNAAEAAAEPARADAGGDTREHDNGHRLAGGAAVGFDFFVNRSVQRCSANQSLKEGVRWAARGRHTSRLCKGLARAITRPS